MKLIIDGNEIVARPEQSLLDMAKELGLVKGSLATDPIVAKIAGQTFTLNYVPLRLKDIAVDQDATRKAMDASGGIINLIRYNDPMGKDAYNRTAQFVLFLALHQLWPQARARINCTIGSGLYVEVKGIDNFSAERLKKHVQEIVAADIPLLRKRKTTEEAIKYYKEKGQEDKAKLLSYRKLPYLDLYKYGDYLDYLYGEMAPSTSFLRSWDILPAINGFIFVFPDSNNPSAVSTYHESPNFFRVYNESKRWCELMDCDTVADINELVDSGKIRELIRVNEALHEKSFSQVADLICERNAKAVMLAGPSSSGKTTSANRLSIQLRVHGKHPILISLDDYYVDRDKILPGPDGKVDLEHINTIDTKLFAQNLAELLEGKTVSIPEFNFKTGKREWNGKTIKLEENSIIIVEGIHGLNPSLIPKGLDKGSVFKLFVSPFSPVNLDDHNRIPSSYLRLLRRTVRDYSTRNSTVQDTLNMWDSVRRGEEKWIFPYQEYADVIFNSATIYELAVLKKHIFPMLNAIQPDDSYYTEVRTIVKILNFVHEADVDDEIPPTSIVREFIGGNAFYKNKK